MEKVGENLAKQKAERDSNEKKTKTHVLAQIQTGLPTQASISLISEMET